MNQPLMNEFNILLILVFVLLGMVITLFVVMLNQRRKQFLALQDLDKKTRESTEDVLVMLKKFTDMKQIDSNFAYNLCTTLVQQKSATQNISFSQGEEVTSVFRDLGFRFFLLYTASVNLLSETLRQELFKAGAYFLGANQIHIHYNTKNVVLEGGRTGLLEHNVFQIANTLAPDNIQFKTTHQTNENKMNVEIFLSIK